MKKEENTVDLSTLESAEVAKATAMSQKNRRHKRRMKLFGGAAALVVFVTTYMLILPAITLTGTPTCGIEEHTHTDSCYTEEQVLTCGQAESAGHTHTESCYDAEGNLICGLQETAGHTHTADCYTTERTLTCTTAEHVHSSNCYSQTDEDADEAGTADAEDEASTSDAESSAEEDDDEELPVGDSTADVETAADWEATFAGVSLTGDWGADTIAIAKTQIGYCESTANFISYKDENGDVVKKGYSRYAAWYHNGTSSYGDWCAMFCSFCYHYAGVPESAMPEHSGVPAWISLLNSCGQYHRASSGYVPKTGDLIFYDWESDGVSDHVALVAGYSNGVISTIEGNFNDMVAACSYSYGDYRIMGYGELPEQDTADDDEITLAAEVEDTAETVDADEADDAETVGADDADAADSEETAEETEKADVADAAEATEETEAEAEITKETSADEETSTEEPDAETVTSTQTAKTEGFSVTTEYTDAAALPEDAVLQVTEIDPNSDTFAAYAVEYESATGKTMDFLLDISFYADGVEVEPAAPVQITLRFTEQQAEQNTELSLVHFKRNDAPELVGCTPVDNNCETCFSLDSFSLLGGSNDDDNDSDETTTTGTTYSSELKNFLKSVTLTDSSGNPVGDTVYLGENYTFSLRFAENNDVGSEAQFQYDSAGYLNYQLDTTKFSNIQAVDQAPLKATSDITIGTLTIKKGDTIGYYSLTSDGKLTVQMNNYSYTDEDGTAYTDRNLIDIAQNVDFYVDFTAQVHVDSGAESWSVPFSDDITIHGTVEKDGELSAKKTAGSYSDTTHTISYTIEVTCTNGRVTGPFTFEDESTLTTADTIVHQNWTEILQDSVKYYTLDGKTELSADTLPSYLDAGEGYLIKYDLHIKDDVYDLLDQTAEDNTAPSVYTNVTVNNTITITGYNGTDNPPSTTATASKGVRITHMYKSYKTMQLQDTDGNTVYVHQWTVTIGDGSKLLTGDGKQGDVTFTDTLGSGLSFFTASKDYPYIQVVVTKEDGSTQTLKYYYDTTKSQYVTLSDDGKTASMSLPAGTKYSVTYYTTLESGKTEDGAYSNTAKAGLYPNPIQVITSTASSIGIPGISKELTSYDGDYLTYTVTVNMPAEMYGQGFFLSDALLWAYASDTSKLYIADASAVAEEGNLTVTITKEDGTVVPLTQYSGSGDTTDTYTLCFGSSNGIAYRFQLRFGTTKTGSYSTGSASASTEPWPYNENTVLTVTYKIPKSARYNDKGGTLANQLAWGNAVVNQAEAKYGTEAVSDVVTHYERIQVNKWAFQSGSDIEYEVRFNNKRNTDNSSDYVPFLTSSFNGAYLKDTYDSRLKLDPNQKIYAYVYEINNGGKSLASFECAAGEAAVTDNTFTVKWSSFTKTEDTTGSSKTDLESFMEESYDKYFIIFYYYMQPNDNSFDGFDDAEGMTVSNSASIGFTQDPDTNPQQIETSPGTATITYHATLLYKYGWQETDGSNEITYEIDVNTSRVQLTEGNLEVVDQMGDNLILYQDTIAFETYDYDQSKYVPVSGCSYVYNEDDNTITFTVPGDQYVCITYTCRVDTDTAGSVEVNNTATINGHTSYSAGGSNTFDITDTSGGGSASTAYLIVQKQDADNLAPMDGVTFDLYGPENADRQHDAPNGVAATITGANGSTLYYYTSYTTAQSSSTLDGVFLITDAMLSNNGLYALVERNTPAGYVPQKDPISFTWNADDAHAVGGVKNYTNRETLTIQNERYYYSLPSTGGSGTRMFTLGGIALMLAALVIGFGSRRRRERRAER